jgi:hypothetical protein
LSVNGRARKPDSTAFLNFLITLLYAATDEKPYQEPCFCELNSVPSKFTPSQNLQMWPYLEIGSLDWKWWDITVIPATQEDHHPRPDPGKSTRPI